MAAVGVLLAVFVGITLAVALLVAVYAAYERERARVDSALLAASERYGGQVLDSFWSGKKLKLRLGDVPAELTYFRGSDKAPPWTKLHVKWSGPQLRVVPEKGWASLKKMFGAQDIEIGERDFDRMFLVQGQPRSVRKALTPVAQRKLKLLYSLGKTHGFFGGNRAGVTLDVTPAGVVVKCLRNLTRTRRDLLQFLEHCDALLAELRGLPGAAPQISVEAVVTAGKCPVCSDGSGQLSRRCRGCNAAYHAECWHYLGGCAIFGCEDRYRPEQAREPSW